MKHLNSGGAMTQTTEAEFSQFWSYYPKKKSKGDAYKAWIQTASKRPDLATVLKALVVLRESPDWLKEGGQFVPYPSTWLRAWGWADVAECDLDGVRGDAMWWTKASGIDAKAKELGLKWDAIGGETYQQFAALVKHEAEKRKLALVRSA